MIVVRNLVATWVRSATAVLGTVVFAPFLVFADSIPVTPEQISVTPQPILPTFQEVGKAGEMPFVLTVKNISKTQTIRVKASPAALSPSVLNARWHLLDEGTEMRRIHGLACCVANFAECKHVLDGIHFLNAR